MDTIQFYENIPLQIIKIEDISLGVRQIGKGKDIIFVHGFPTHGYTWRKLLPELSKHFRCHILDLPGLGDSSWTKQTDFTSAAQARYVMQYLDMQNIQRYSLIAHNSGATIAREMAIQEANKVEHLIMFNTEIPNHRPPWIPLYQKMGTLPLVPAIIRLLLKQKWFIHSPMGFRELYAQKSLLDEAPNIAPYIQPILSSTDKTIGAFKYLKGIDWRLIDGFERTHGDIKANVLFLWGEKDKTFPTALGQEMTKQFNGKCEFKNIKNASLLPHEEQPKEVVQEILFFLS